MSETFGVIRLVERVDGLMDISHRETGDSLIVPRADFLEMVRAWCGDVEDAT